jgi:purine-binding chemotaxis protein CheW
METPEATLRQLVAFRVGAQELCVEIAAVKEIRPWAAVTPLPHAPAFVLGVINLRGSVLPVIDLGARLGIPVGPPTNRNVIVICWIDKQLVGLLVDAVCDILTADNGAIQPISQVAGAAADALIGGLLNTGDRLLSCVALEHLLVMAEAA